MEIIETLTESCKDVAEGISGLEVVDKGVGHLRITDPKLALWFQPLSREVVNDVPNPPKLFLPETDFVDKDTPVPVPWMSPTQEYIQEYVSKEEYIVSFVNHGEFRTGTSTYQGKTGQTDTRKRDMKIYSMRGSHPTDS